MVGKHEREKDNATHDFCRKIGYGFESAYVKNRSKQVIITKFITISGEIVGIQ
jgi:hypothetical protein